MDRRLPLLLIPLVLLASPEARAAESTDLAGSLGQMVLGLGVVLGLLLGTLWLLKRIAAPRGSASHLRILGATPVGPRERVVLVEVAGRVLVLGVAPGRINTLHTLESQDLPPALAGTPPAPGDFQARLRQLLERPR